MKIYDHFDARKLQTVTGQNGSGRNGMDKMVQPTDKMSLDKRVWTKWYRQNGTDEMVASFGIDHN